MAAHAISDIQPIVAELAQKYGAQRVYLFGSYAWGDMDEASDVDLRIDKGRIKGLELASLLLDLEDALGVSVDLISTGSLDKEFLSAI
nr:nucleotidyltransferase domain-containing protein [uncultured Oscillibacter sp.]